MKIGRLIATLTLFLSLSQGCRILKLDKVTSNTFDTQLSFCQNNNTIMVDGVSNFIEIEREPFSLKFYNRKYDSVKKRYHSAQIAAFTDKSEFDKIKTGMSKDDLECFSSGSGIAAGRNGKYESLIFSNSGHNYTFYENPEHERLILLKESNGILRLEYQVNSVYYDGRTESINEIELSIFYLAFLIDKNLDGVIDNGELNKLTIKIK